MSRYDRARKAFEDEAWRVSGLLGFSYMATPYDMTGGYVESDDFWALLKNPTKSKAASCYEAMLEYADAAGWDDNSQPYFPPQQAAQS